MKRALLIGSPTMGLEGTRRDVDAMKSLLEPRGFDVVECFAKEATRDKIICAWKNIITQSEPDDVVIIYYTGHGGKPINPNPYSGVVPLHFIVPFDWNNIDFRGITSL